MNTNNNYDDFFNLSFGSLPKKSTDSQSKPAKPQEQTVQDISKTQLPSSQTQDYPSLAAGPKKSSTPPSSTPAKKPLSYASAVQPPKPKIDYAAVVKRDKTQASSESKGGQTTPSESMPVSTSPKTPVIPKQNSHTSNDNQYRFNTKITEALNRGNDRLAHQLLSELEQIDEPNILTLYPFLKYYSKSGQEAPFKAILEKMKVFGLVKDSQVYASEMNLYIAMDNKQTASKIKALLEEMKTANVQQTAATFSTYLKYFVSNPKLSLEEVEKELKNLREPDVVLYNTLINCYLKRNNIKQALFHFENMKTTGLKPTESTYSTLLNYYVAEGRETDALDLVNSMLDDKLTPDARILTILMNFYIKQNNEPEATRYFKTLTANYPITLSTFQTLLNFYNNSQNYDLMKTLWDQMGELKIKPTTLIYNLMFNYGLAVEDQPFCETLLKQITPQQLKEDDILKNNLLKYYTKFVSAKAAYAKFLTLPNHHQRNYSLMISLLVSKGNLDEARELLKTMQTKFTPDPITLDPFIRYYFNEGKYEQLEDILKLLPPSSLPIHSYVNKYIEWLVENDQVKHAEALMKTYYPIDATKSEYDLHECSFGSGYVLVRLLMSEMKKGKTVTFITGRSLGRDKEMYGLRKYLIKKLKENHPNIIIEINPSNPGRLELKKV